MKYNVKVYHTGKQTGDNKILYTFHKETSFVQVCRKRKGQNIFTLLNI